MQMYTQELRVKRSDLDARNHVNNVCYVQRVQDIAEAHWLLKSSENHKKTPTIGL